MRLNKNGNSYPENQPIFSVIIIKNGSWYNKGSIIEVMESLNPYFTGMWRINDSMFIKKEYCKILLR